ncbi:hypothetical protein EO98_16425 [Methanosarcina sp. 2.H.T.1A.6]|nr:hypothetical protein EO94_13575 [Methanosarcina sp. 2.H.T.1A.3]KKG18946.1 hypothetical protein EO97_08275 [Methanosarcina sp. 2.H.T.1A.15]KKG21480.1 hypothetical protein EO96_08160 [Methanosarcina sp. 2.H.T.1A.8]KKG21972.1 hypothetical protein EO98_16425 [Methanosarcina sp. 2.H.T.1A.6]
MDPPADQTAGKIYGNKKTKKYGGERSSKMQYGGTVSEKLPAPLNFLSLQSALLSVYSSLGLSFSQSALSALFCIACSLTKYSIAIFRFSFLIFPQPNFPQFIFPQLIFP